MMTDSASDQRLAPSRQLALSKTEAAEALGISVDFLDEHVFRDLRVVRRGRRVLIPVKELERWLDREAALTLDVDWRR
jgi:excisionase family DNA binding protein